jgi:tetratricopeptide (TPR) repeat protein
MTSSTGDRRIRAWAAVLVAGWFAGAAAFAGTLASAEAALAKAEPRDRTLYQLQAGVAALREDQRDAAVRYLDPALDSIESVFSNREGAAKARSLWYEEGSKDFKGEPYERAMAFYYRGLAYLSEGDYENARASFRGGLMQSSFAEEQQFRSGFASLMVLEGWTSQLLGDPQAADAYAEAQRYRPDWKQPGAQDNTLVIAELAGSPRKVGDGIGLHEIVYRKARRTPEASIEVALGSGAPLKLYPMEDLFFQATHRGTRAIDRIIDGKVSFRDTTGEVGDALGRVASEGSVVSAAFGGQGGAALGGVAALGAIASLLSSNVKPAADVRYWANLPETLHVATLRTAGDQPVAVKLFDAQGAPVTSDALVVRQWTDPRGNRVVWIKTRN